MKKENFTPAIAQSFLNQSGITESDVMPVFATVSGNSRASFISVTEVTPAAKHKLTVSIKKVSAVNCAVYAGMKPETNPYLNKMAKAGKLDHELQENWFTHYNGIFSLVAKRSNMVEKYLYALPDSGTSHYFINGELSSKETVLEYLTPSEQKKLTTKSETVCCRVYKLDNIKQIQCKGELITND